MTILPTIDAQQITLRRWRRVAPALMLVVAAFLLNSDRSVSAQDRLFEKEPFDRITLDAANDNVVLEVEPLDLPDRKVPEKPSPNKTLDLRLMDNPGQPYQVKWKSIEKVELFEQMVLAEANRLVRAKKLDEAYDYFQFLEENYPTLPGLEEGIENYLYEEAKSLHLAEQYEAALAVLRDLHQRNPQHQGIENALGLTTEKLVEQHVANNDYRTARELLDELAKLYPQHAVVAKWRSDFQKQAEGLLADARQADKKGELRKAGELARKIKAIWPNLSGALEFLKSLHDRYSRVIVAVTTPAPKEDPNNGNPGQLDDWALRRSRRLLYRTISEFTGPGTEGGNYICPLGSMEIQELGLRLAFQLKPGLQWSTGDATLTGLDLSQRLMAIADPGQPIYRVEWAELLAGCSVEDIYSVKADFTRPHVRPEALLQTTVVPFGSLVGDAPAAPPTNGPYIADRGEADGDSLFVTNTRYFASEPDQPKEIVERHFPAGAQALWELERHRIDVLDRVNPWDLEEANKLKNVVIEPYGMPLVHCLVPNVRKRLLGHRAFRRALVYGIHREAILDHLLGGHPTPGCRVVSGPFPPGSGREDPLGYAYDAWIEPRGYEPRLAIALAQIAMQELAAANKKQGISDVPSADLVLAYPADEIAKRASNEIQRQLGLVGITVTLKELPPGVGSRVPDDVDLLYAELAVWEPVVDARRLLGSDGISGGASPYMAQALRQLDLAPDWLQVSAKLHQIHHLAHQEVALIPLWQMTDHFAYHRSLEGVGNVPVTLYQNVEHWRPEFTYQADDE